jgi:hypothetical protein
MHEMASGRQTRRKEKRKEKKKGKKKKKSKRKGKEMKGKENTKRVKVSITGTYH